MVADINFVLAVVLGLLVIYISWSHLQEHGFHSPIALLGLTVIALVALGIVSSFPGAFDIADKEPYRFGTAFFRGVALTLLGGYALHRWHRR